MIEKNRGNEVILEMVEVLKNKNFEFPRAHQYLRGLSIQEKGIPIHRKHLPLIYMIQKSCGNGISGFYTIPLNGQNSTWQI